MSRRWILVVTGLAVLLAGLTVAAGLRYLIPQLSSATVMFDGTEDQVDIEAYYQWINSGWSYYSMVPWLATAALLCAVVALTLAARRAQLASAVATVSRESARS